MKAPSRITAFLALAFAATTVAAMGIIFMDGRGLIPSEKRAQYNSKNPLESLGGPFTLVNQFGKTVTEADFSDRFMLVYFGYTSCPDVCPKAINQMLSAIESLGKDKDKVVPVFISVDPERDTPDKLKEYLAKFDPNMVGLTGTPEQVKAVLKEYRAYASKVPIKGRPDNEYSIDHSSFIFFIGPDSKYRVIFGDGSIPIYMTGQMRDFLKK